MSERRNPAYVKRRRHLLRMMKLAETKGAVEHYFRLYRKHLTGAVGYDPWRDDRGSPRAG